MFLSSVALLPVFFMFSNYPEGREEEFCKSRDHVLIIPALPSSACVICLLLFAEFLSALSHDYWGVLSMTFFSQHILSLWVLLWRSLTRLAGSFSSTPGSGIITQTMIFLRTSLFMVQLPLRSVFLVIAIIWPTVLFYFLKQDVSCFSLGGEVLWRPL